MTDAEILQSRYDHAHLREEIAALVQCGTPTRWSLPLRTYPASSRLTIAHIFDYEHGYVLTVGYPAKNPSQQDILRAARERALRAAALRKKGKTYREIGKLMGNVTVERARELVRKALRLERR